MATRAVPEERRVRRESRKGLLAFAPLALSRHLHLAAVALGDVSPPVRRRARGALDFRARRGQSPRAGADRCARPDVRPSWLRGDVRRFGAHPAGARGVGAPRAWALGDACLRPATVAGVRAVAYRLHCAGLAYGTLVVGMLLWFAVPPDEPYRTENAVDDFMTRTTLGLDEVKRRVLRRRDCPFRSVIVIWDTTPEALREWREGRSPAYGDAANASLDNPLGASLSGVLSDSLEKAVSKAGIPESEAPSMSLHLDARTNKKASGKRRSCRVAPFARFPPRCLPGSVPEGDVPIPPETSARGRSSDRGLRLRCVAMPPACSGP